MINGIILWSHSTYIRKAILYIRGNTALPTRRARTIIFANLKLNEKLKQFQANFYLWIKLLIINYRIERV